MARALLLFSLLGLARYASVCRFWSCSYLDIGFYWMILVILACIYLIFASVLYSPVGGRMFEKSSFYFLKHKNLPKNPSSLPGVFETLAGSLFGGSIFKVYNCAYFYSSYLSCPALLPLLSILSSSYFYGTSYFLNSPSFGVFIWAFLASADYFSTTIGDYSYFGKSYFLTLVSSLVTSSQGGGTLLLSSNISLSMSAGLSTILDS